MYTPTAKPVHLVKNFHEVNKKHLDPNRVLYGSEKIDGVYAYGLCTPNDSRIFSRTGEECLSLKHLEAELAELGKSGKFMPFVIIFEVYREGWPVNKISGAFRRQSEQFTEAVAKVHDLVPYQDFVDGLCKIDFRVRYVAADITTQNLKSFDIIQVHQVDLQDCEQFAQDFIDNGGEGAVFKWEDSIWQAGKKNQEQMKIKQGLSYDLEVIGHEEGKGKYEGTLGKLHCHFRRYGKQDGEPVIVKVSGMSDKQRDDWWDGGNEYPSINGEIIKVDAMCLTEHGMLREPRFKELRVDKDRADFK